MARTRTGKTLLAVLAGALLVLSTGADSSGCAARKSGSGAASAKSACRGKPAHVLCWPTGTVYVEDHTGARWPVRQQTANWAAGLKLHVRYGACRAGAGCIRVRERNVGASGSEGGKTNVNYDRDSGDVVGDAQVTLNTWLFVPASRGGAGGGPPEAKQVTCHELGHAFGQLDHDDPGASLSGCLIANVEVGAVGPGRQRPSSGELATINSIYG